ncbi:hypothetical protein CO038_03345 [Candidatus Pacearchaeota archaeon CG_4_9_14_0_2_um_filter_39_13]|nr:MAG: hypothetical protein CO038_03345 [Candidatus Pacearchaeota archaeon CG_4_9_14_0_2_um_filter_39_13]QBM01490.1 CRISPR-associated protein Cas14b.12 [uncultured archaeon]
MKALKLQLIPTRKQYKILDEMFWKWASLANRVSQKGESKETLAPKKDIQKIQFNATQLNQIEKDIKDLRGAMKEQQKQKERLLLQIQERRSTISEMLNDDNNKERDPHRPLNFRPKGWRKFHTSKHWVGELSKILRQEDRVKKTIERIVAGKISFKPKRIGIWSSNYKINFFKRKISINPLNSKGFELTLMTEPTQDLIGKNGGKSVLNNKRYLDDSIKSLLMFALHSRFFGLNNTDTYLLGGKINPSLVKYYKKNQDMGEFGREIVEKFERKLKQEINEQQKKIIMSQIKEQYSNRDSAFNKDYLGLINEFSEVFNQRKSERAEYLLDSFEDKIKQIKQEIGESLNISDWDFLIDEAKKAYGYEEGFTEYVYSKRYLEILNKIVKAVLITDIYFDLRKYPILLRKPLDKIKKISNLKPDEWSYYIQFGYDSINPVQLMSTDKFLGIDRGLTHLLAYSVFDKEKKEFIINQLEPNPIMGWKWKLRKVKRSLQHLERRIRAQKMVKLPENQMKKKLKSIEPKIEVHYHNISRKIVNLAKDYNASIVVESLEGGGLKQHGRKKNARNRSLNYALSLFDYGKIASLIKYKADLEGVPMYEVLPAYTSQQCAKCVLEKGSFVDPEIIGYVEDIGIKGSLLDSLFEGTELSSIQVLKKIKNKIELSARDNHNKEINLILKYNFKGLVIVRGQDKEEIAEHPIKEINGKFAILDFVYKRGKEKVGKKGNQKVRYTGNKKVGYCSKHGQVDADLNASRVIALCKYLDINDPILFGEQRKSFK